MAIVEGMQVMEGVENVGGMYRAWGSTLKRGIAMSTHLTHPRAQSLWLAFYELGLNGGHAKGGPLTLPPSTTVEHFRATVPGCKLKVTQLEEGPILSLLNRPSWLLGTKTTLTEFLSLAHDDTTWLGQ